MLIRIQNASPSDASLAAAPLSPAFHRFNTEFGEHIMLVNGSRVFSISKGTAAALDAASSEKAESLLGELGLSAPAFIPSFIPSFISDEPLAHHPVRSISLAIAQKCNLACGYCYAQAGSFGGDERDMSAVVAFTAIDLLFANASPGERLDLAFLGGEPLTNRSLLRRCTERASELAVRKDVKVGFSITTNGTLLTAADAEFFERHGFAVTVSLDGPGSVNDRLRPFKSGKGTHDRVLRKVAPLLAVQQRMQVSARVTVTPENLFLRETLGGFLELGFHSVGFSPMLSSPTGIGEMRASDLQSMLAGMIECGREFERRLLRGERYAFSNMYTALHEIHKGTHRPYPCGAGAGYVGVSAEGGLYACHRFVEDESGWLGRVQSGVDPQRQQQWLALRHVHLQAPCRSCWAKYLCGGGCHYEVAYRGRPACDYIRGWLHYCLEAYIRILERKPSFFGAQGEP